MIKLTDDNFTDVCRICLKTKSNTHHVFDGTDKHLWSKIILCADIQVPPLRTLTNVNNQIVYISFFYNVYLDQFVRELSQDDGLPASICEVCYTQVDQAMELRQLCELSDLLLRNHLKMQEQPTKSQMFDMDCPLYTEIRKDEQNSASYVDLSEAQWNESIADFNDSQEAMTELVARDLIGTEMTVDPDENIKTEFDGTLRSVSKIKMSPPTTSDPYNLPKSPASCSPLSTSETYNLPKQPASPPTINEPYNLPKSPASPSATTEPYNLPKLPAVSEPYNPPKPSESPHATSEPYNLPKPPASPPSTSEPYKFGKPPASPSATSDSYNLPKAPVSPPATSELSKLPKPHSEKILPRKRDPNRQRTADGDFECEFCKKRFNKSSNLNAHIRIHKSDRKHKCQQPGCSSAFLNSKDLINHTRTHTRERPYDCGICHQRFSQISHLRKHVVTHDGALVHQTKPFKCQTCDKRFPLKAYLQLHEKCHTNYRPHICETCKKGFLFSGDLIKHQRVHTGEKPYSCDICQKTFTQNGTMRVHRKTVHKDVTWTPFPSPKGPQPKTTYKKNKIRPQKSPNESQVQIGIRKTSLRSHSNHLKNINNGGSQKDQTHNRNFQIKNEDVAQNDHNAVPNVQSIQHLNSHLRIPTDNNQNSNAHPVIPTGNNQNSNSRPVIPTSNIQNSNSNTIIPTGNNQNTIIPNGNILHSNSHLLIKNGPIQNSNAHQHGKIHNFNSHHIIQNDYEHNHIVQNADIQRLTSPQHVSNDNIQNINSHNSMFQNTLVQNSNLHHPVVQNGNALNPNALPSMDRNGGIQNLNSHPMVTHNLQLDSNQSRDMLLSQHQNVLSENNLDENLCNLQDDCSYMSDNPNVTRVDLFEFTCSILEQEQSCESFAPILNSFMPSNLYLNS